jgi:hypothetical protein
MVANDLSRIFIVGLNDASILYKPILSVADVCGAGADGRDDARHGGAAN